MTPGAFRDAARRKVAMADAARTRRHEAAGDRGPAHRGPTPPPSPCPRSGVHAEATARAYSNPNSVDALWPEAAGGARGADDVVGVDCAPALAARADGPDDAGAEPVVPPAPSKPNSLLA